MPALKRETLARRLRSSLAAEEEAEPYPSPRILRPYKTIASSNFAAPADEDRIKDFPAPLPPPPALEMMEPKLEALTG